MKATIGRTVIIKNCHSNGSYEQPATITRVWSGHGTEHGPVGINVTVFPDGGQPTNLSSVMLYHDRAAAEAVLAVSEGKPFVAFWPERV